jgi:hypothetical protein
MTHNSASRGWRAGLRRTAVTVAATAAAAAGVVATTAPAHAAVTGTVFHGFETVTVNQDGHVANINANGSVESHGPILSRGTSTAGVGIAANLANGTFQEVLRASDGSVYTGNNAGFSKFGSQTADANSTPAIAFDSSGQRIIEIAQRGVLLFFGPSLSGALDNVAPNTSPSVAPLASPGKFISTWVNSVGTLIWNSDLNNVHNNSVNGFDVQPGTSPVVSTSGNHWRIEARDTAGALWVATDTNPRPTGPAVAGGVLSSPSITSLSNGSFLDAYAGGAGNDLFVGGGDTGLPVLRGTNPSIAGNGTGGWRVVYEGTDFLEHTLDSSGRTATITAVLPNSSISPQSTGLFTK